MNNTASFFRLALTGLIAASLLLGGCVAVPQEPDLLSEAEMNTAIAATIHAALSLTPPATITPTIRPPTLTPSPFPTLEILPSSTPRPTSTPFPSITPRPSATVPPTPTLTPITGLILQDDFSTQSGWWVEKGDGYLMEYVDGAYRMTINQISGLIPSIRDFKEYRDIHLEVEATLTGGPENGYYGVVCRFKDGANFYALVMGSDGFYAIGRMLNGTFTFLERGKNLTGIIRGPGLINLVMADCSGKNLSLYANGTRLVRVEDATITGGGYGLVVGTRPNAGAQVTFDDFLATEPRIEPTPTGASPTP